MANCRHPCFDVAACLLFPGLAGSGRKDKPAQYLFHERRFSLRPSQEQPSHQKQYYHDSLLILNSHWHVWGIISGMSGDIHGATYPRCYISTVLHASLMPFFYTACAEVTAVDTSMLSLQKPGYKMEKYSQRSPN